MSHVGGFLGPADPRSLAATAQHRHPPARPSRRLRQERLAAPSPAVPSSAWSLVFLGLSPTPRNSALTAGSPAGRLTPGTHRAGGWKPAAMTRGNSMSSTFPPPGGPQGGPEYLEQGGGSRVDPLQPAGGTPQPQAAPVRRRRGRRWPPVGVGAWAANWYSSDRPPARRGAAGQDPRLRQHRPRPQRRPEDRGAADAATSSRRSRTRSASTPTTTSARRSSTDPGRGAAATASTTRDDIEPWLGDRAAFAAVDLGGDQPSRCSCSRSRTPTRPTRASTRSRTAADGSDGRLGDRGRLGGHRRDRRDRRQVADDAEGLPGRRRRLQALDRRGRRPRRREPVRRPGGRRLPRAPTLFGWMGRHRVRSSRGHAQDDSAVPTCNTRAGSRDADDLRAEGLQGHGRHRPVQRRRPRARGRRRRRPQPRTLLSPPTRGADVVATAAGRHRRRLRPRLRRRLVQRLGRPVGAVLRARRAPRT